MNPQTKDALQPEDYIANIVKDAVSKIEKKLTEIKEKHGEGPKYIPKGGDPHSLHYSIESLNDQIKFIKQEAIENTNDIIAQFPDEKQKQLKQKVLEDLTVYEKTNEMGKDKSDDEKKIIPAEAAALNSKFVQAPALDIYSRFLFKEWEEPEQEPADDFEPERD